jgi:hypothetical protein
MKVETGLMIPTLQFGPDDVFLYEDWRDSPVGPYKALFHYAPDDVRTLYASTREGLDMVPVIHRFDRRVLSDIKTSWGVGQVRVEVNSDAESYDLELEFKENLLLKLANPSLKFVPAFVLLNPVFQAVAPKLLAPVLGTDPNMSMGGNTETGTLVRFEIRRMWFVTGGRCSRNGQGLGSLCDCTQDHDMGAFRPIPKPMMTKLSLHFSEGT